MSAESATTVAKGFRAASHLVRRDNRTYGALSAGDGVFVTSISAVGTDGAIEIFSSRTGQSDTAWVIGLDDRLGIAILRTDTVADTDRGILASLPAAMMPEPGMRVVHPSDGSKVNCHPSITLTAAVDDDSAPVTVDSPIKGAAIVTDAWGTALGVVVDRPGGHRMISGAALVEAVEATTMQTNAASS